MLLIVTQFCLRDWTNNKRMTFNLIVFDKKYSIYKFRKDAVLPEWVYATEFCSLTRTEEELSVVTVQTDHVSDWVECSKDWRILKIEGPLDFSLTGVIADISLILKEVRISIFIISTYDTDYILVKEKNLKTALDSLQNKGYNIREE
jgi:uncharacterized protein